MATPQIQQIRARAEAGNADAQFLLSQICGQNGDLNGMVGWLRKASSNGVPDALDALGHCLEKGIGVPRDPAAAFEHYDRAVKSGSLFAAFHKAEFLYKSRQGPDNAEQICELLVNAAQADIVPALRALGFLAMQVDPSGELAIGCLRRAAMLGDPVSSFNLAWCLLQEQVGDEARQESAHWLEQAAAANYPLVETLLPLLDGAEPMPPAHAATGKIEFTTSVPIYPLPQGVEQKVYSEDPTVASFDDVLTLADRAYLIFLARPYLKRSAVINPGGDVGGQVSQVRTSQGTYLPTEVVDLIGRYVELKIIVETGGELECSEPMSILHYSPGEYYRPHVDYFNPNFKVSEALFEDGGQRTYSAVTYLVAPSKGGGTSFPRLDITVPPVAGSTLWFSNCFADGQVDERSLHAGDTVDEGDKWVVTKWFRETATRYVDD